jgi:hypothetical protein
MQTLEAFEYSSQPHAAPIKKKTKYRNESDNDAISIGDAQNLMF